MAAVGALPVSYQPLSAAALLASQILGAAVPVLTSTNNSTMVHLSPGQHPLKPSSCGEICYP